jgi:hypothetical protein
MGVVLMGILKKIVAAADKAADKKINKIMDEEIVEPRVRDEIAQRRAANQKTDPKGGK